MGDSPTLGKFWGKFLRQGGKKRGQRKEEKRGRKGGKGKREREREKGKKKRERKGKMFGHFHYFCSFSYNLHRLCGMSVCLNHSNKRLGHVEMQEHIG